MAYTPPISVDFDFSGAYTAPDSNNVAFDLASSTTAPTVHCVITSKQVQKSLAITDFGLTCHGASKQVQKTLVICDTVTPIYCTVTSKQTQSSRASFYTPDSPYLLRAHLGDIQSKNSNMLGNLITR